MEHFRNAGSVRHSCASHTHCVFLARAVHTACTPRAPCLLAQVLVGEGQETKSDVRTSYGFWPEQDEVTQRIQVGEGAHAACPVFALNNAADCWQGRVASEPASRTWRAAAVGPQHRETLLATAHRSASIAPWASQSLLARVCTCSTTKLARRWVREPASRTSCVCTNGVVGMVAAKWGENQLCVHQRLVGMVAAQSIAGCRSNKAAMLPRVQYDAHNDHVMDGSEYLKARNNVRCGRCRHWVVRVLGGLPHAGRQA